MYLPEQIFWQLISAIEQQKINNRSWFSNDHIFCLISLLCSGTEEIKGTSKEQVSQFLSDYRKWLHSKPPDYCNSLKLNKQFEEGIFEAREVFMQARQRLLKAIHKENLEQYLKKSPQNRIVSCETIARQLIRRFDDFRSESNHVFYTGVADYIDFAFKRQILADFIFDTGQADKSDNHSDHGAGKTFSFEESFMEVELIHNLVHNIGQLPNHRSNDKYLQLYYDLCCAEFKWLIDEYEEVLEQCIKRSEFNVHILRVHHILLESLESNSSENCNKAIQYRYSHYGVPCGELLVHGLEPLIFTKNPASVLQFFFVHRDSGKYYTYNNYNLYWHGKCPGLSSNSFRLLISGINQRVRKHSHCVVQELIGKRGQENFNEVGFYRLRS